MSDTADKEKSSTSNGLGVDPLRRLASFKAPRDLSLGGIKLNKKIFTPNLLVTRNKNRGHHSGHTHQKREDKNKKDAKSKHNRNIPKVIKSSGVFSEGLGSMQRRINPTNYSRGEHSTSPERPTLRIRSRIKVEQDERRIRKLSDGQGAEEGEDDRKARLDLDAPIKLPMGDTGLWKRVANLEAKVKRQYAPKTKLEGDIPPNTVKQKVFVDIEEEKFADIDAVNMLKCEEPTLILVQLPASLPGRGGRSDAEPPRHGHNQHTSADTAKSAEEKLEEDKCHLAELEEGRIGTLRVHRSGRVSFALGNSVFDVVSGVSKSFHEEVVSMAADDSSRSANLVSLGKVNRKMVIFPDWQRLMRDVIF